MKATIKYVPLNSGKRRQVTISAAVCEVNAIIAEAIRSGKFGRLDHIFTVRCGRCEYQWHDLAIKALPTDIYGRVKGD